MTELLADQHCHCRQCVCDRSGSDGSVRRWKKTQSLGLMAALASALVARPGSPVIFIPQVRSPRAARGRSARRLRRAAELRPGRAARACRSRCGRGIGNSHEAVTHDIEGGPGVLRPGAQLPRVVRVDRGVAVVPAGAAPRPESGHGVSGFELRLLRARERGRRPAALREGEGARVRRVSERERRRIDIRGEAARGDRRHQGREPVSRLQRKPSTTRSPQYFDDPQLWLLRGNAEEANASGAGQRGGAASIAFYATALRLVPDHASAHHYLVHSYETIGPHRRGARARRGLRAPRAVDPHAAHMWGHDLRRVGRVDDAIAQFQKADALERAYYAAEKIDPALDWHHAPQPRPARELLRAQGADEAGRDDAARVRGARRAVSAYRAFNMRGAPELPDPPRPLPGSARGGARLTRTAYPQSRCVGHALAGQALLWLERPDEAKQELEAAGRELAERPSRDRRARSFALGGRAVGCALRGEPLLRRREAGGRARRAEGRREGAARRSPARTRGRKACSGSSRWREARWR